MGAPPNPPNPPNAGGGAPEDDEAMLEEEVLGEGGLLNATAKLVATPAVVVEKRPAWLRLLAAIFLRK